MIEKFKLAFGIPEENRLLETNSKSKGPIGGLESWEHEEIDSKGNIVARYESWHNVTPDLIKDSGFRKYSPAGELLDEANELKL